MTQEDKDLLFKDLSARLPHHVRVKVWLKDGTTEEGFLDLEHNYGDVLQDAFYYSKIKDIKPYLRAMSSITVEEKEELLIYVLDNKEDCKRFKINDDGAIESIDNNIFRWVYFGSDTTSRYIDWLNKNHFDYRGLIEKGLAIEVKEERRMI